jgi:hypothetical protein
MSYYDVQLYPSFRLSLEGVNTDSKSNEDANADSKSNEEVDADSKSNEKSIA